MTPWVMAKSVEFCEHGHNCPDSNLMLSQPLKKSRADVGTTTSARRRFVQQAWANIGLRFFHLPTFSATFCQPFANLLPTFDCWYSHARHNFLCLKGVQKMSHFKGCFGTCLYAWHFHDILEASGQYVCYKSDSDFVGCFLLLTYLYTWTWLFFRVL